MLPGHKSSISLHFYFSDILYQISQSSTQKSRKDNQNTRSSSSSFSSFSSPPLHHSACNCEWTDGNAEEEAEEDEGQKELGFLHIRSNHGACA